MGRYSATLIGEEDFQPAIARLSPGDPITLRPIFGGPESPWALRCTDAGGETLGYIARDSWLGKTLPKGETAARALVESVSNPAQGDPVQHITLTVLTGQDAGPAKQVPAPATPDKKRGGCLKIAGYSAAALFGLAVINAIVNPQPKTPPVAGKTASAPDEPDEEELAEQAKRNKGFHCLSAWDGSHRELVSALKTTLRDPDSFQHIDTRITPVDDKGNHTLMMNYRARNGFGGMNVGRLAAKVKNSDCSFEIIANADQ